MKMVQDNSENGLIFYARLVVKSKIIQWPTCSRHLAAPPHGKGRVRTYYLEIITWCKSQVLRFRFCPTPARARSPPAQLYFPSVTRLLCKCIHYQAHRPGAIFLLWSSSRIHQPHTHIYLQIIGKAKMFNCTEKVVVICLNSPLKNVDSGASSGKRGVWITILHDFINRRSLH